MDEVIEYLKFKVFANDTSKNPEHEHAASWKDEEGILITYYQAKKIIDSFEKTGVGRPKNKLRSNSNELDRSTEQQCNIVDVSNTVCQDYMHIHYARYCDYDYCPSCGKHIKAN